MSSKKKYYYVKFQSKGRTYYKNQDGKITAKAKVKASKLKIYDLAQRSIKGTNIEAGDLIDRVKSRVSKKSKRFKITGSELYVNNIFLQSWITKYIEREYRIFSQVNGDLFEHSTAQSKANLILFNYELQELFYQFLKPVTDSPFFIVRVVLSVKKKTFLIDWDSTVLDESVQASKIILKAFLKFRAGITRLKNNYFSK